jgi:isoleucyl-tRNA synthetase
MVTSPRPVIVVEDDPFPRAIQAILDPSTPAARTAAFSEFFAHEQPDFASWCEHLRARIGSLYPSEVRLVADEAALANAFGLEKLPGKTYAVIWTTTPWTLPGSQAVSVHPEFTYQLVETSRGLLILAADLVETALKRYGLDGKVLASATGKALERIAVQHPFYSRTVPIVCGEHVTAEATGLVHTAPAHGADDFDVGKVYGLPLDQPVGARRRLVGEQVRRPVRHP